MHGWQAGATEPHAPPHLKARRHLGRHPGAVDGDRHEPAGRLRRAAQAKLLQALVIQQLIALDGCADLAAHGQLARRRRDGAALGTGSCCSSSRRADWRRRAACAGRLLGRRLHGCDEFKALAAGDGRAQQREQRRDSIAMLSRPHFELFAELR